MAIPIWKDHTINLGTDDSVLFRIRVDDANGEIIFQGRATRRPGLSYISISVNNICANYMPAEGLPDFIQAGWQDLEYSRAFVVQKYTTSWVTVETVEFCNNWSYNDDWVEAQGLSFPVTKIDRRQPIVWTWLNIPSSVRCYYSRPNHISWYNRNINVSPYSGKGTVVIIPRDYVSGIDGIKIDVSGVASREYEIVDTCARFALYYLNSYGGWDTALMDGNYTISSDVERHTYKSPYVRNDTNYLNEISKFITLNTGLLTDAQASMMGELMNATNVWLYDMVEDKSYPVVIVDKTWEEKSFRNQGNKMFNYTIRVQVIKNEVRR